MNETPNDQQRPSTTPGHDADVRSWVRESRSETDRVVQRELVVWLRDVWSFEDPRHTVRG